METNKSFKLETDQDGVIAKFKEWVIRAHKEIYNENIETGKTFLPSVICLCKDAAMDYMAVIMPVQPEFWSNTTAKRLLIHALLPSQLLMMQEAHVTPVCLAIVVEAWMVIEKREAMPTAEEWNEIKKRTISEEPNKRETLIFSFETMLNCASVLFPIERTDGKIELGKPTEMLDGIGDMTRILRGQITES